MSDTTKALQELIAAYDALPDALHTTARLHKAFGQARHALQNQAPRPAKASDENGNRWHMLSALVHGYQHTEVLAATCIDGIPFIVRWARLPGTNCWTTAVFSTEWGKWEVNVSATNPEYSDIPKCPPTVWDDMPHS